MATPIIQLKHIFKEVGHKQQLVAIARAIISKPSLILAEEPKGSLHSDHGMVIMELLKVINSQGSTIVQVTHSETNAPNSDRVIRFEDRQDPAR